MHLSTNSSLAQWLQYIEAIHPTEIDLGLTRLKLVASRLISSPTAIVFTVAGTNGKGTTTAALNGLCLAAHKTVGWYSSPHLINFNERFRINGNEITDQMLVFAFCAIEEARQEVSLSYFEYTTLAALYCFDQQKLEVWILEVGLGGRLDAVNIVDPTVSVITNIGLDHQGYLGDNLNSIGIEKAGISRSNRPTVLGSDNLPSSVIETLIEKQAIAYPFNEQHGVEIGKLYWAGGSCSTAQLSIPEANASAACQAFVLSGLKLEPADIEAALNRVSMAGRMQRVFFNGHPAILDVGHNPHAARYLSGKLSGEKCHVVLGMLADKDPKEFVQELQPLVKTLSVVSLEVPRGLSKTELNERINIQADHLFESVGEAVSFLCHKYPGETLFIGGSFYTVCDALVLLENGVGS